MRSSQPIPPPNDTRHWVTMKWSDKSTTPITREKDFHVVLAFGSGNSVSIYMSSRIDSSFSPTLAINNYIINSPLTGNIPVTNVTLGSDLDSIELTLATPLPDKDCTVTIKADTIRGLGGALNPLQNLPILEGGGTAPPPPPEITNISPASGSVIDLDQPISFTVSGQINLLNISVSFPHNKRREVVYGSFGFATNYSTSLVSEISPGSFHFTINRVGGWPKDANPVFTIDAV